MTGQTSAMMALRDPDIRLMLRVRDGDQKAFAELVERYQHRLVAVMHHLVGNSQEAEDLAQEVFLRVYRNREKYSPTAKFATWLFKIANNLALNAQRNRVRRAAVSLDTNPASSSSEWPAQQLASSRDQPPTHQLQQRELEEVIRQALNELNERQRMAIILNKYEDMDYQQIAAVMGLTVKAIKSLLCRARIKLRQALEPYIQMDSTPSQSPDTNALE